MKPFIFTTQPTAQTNEESIRLWLTSFVLLSVLLILFVVAMPAREAANATPAATIANTYLEAIATSEKETLEEQIVDGVIKGTGEVLRQQLRDYVVKKNDSYWKIAVTELDSAAKVNQLIELNKSTVKSPTALKAGMVIKIPITTKELL